jgi:hypothetical protein
MLEENPTDAAKWRHTPTAEKTLRQFLTMESGAYARPSYRKNYETAILEPVALVAPAHCNHCDYVANTIAEVHWHEEHNDGHEVV